MATGLDVGGFFRLGQGLWSLPGSIRPPGSVAVGFWYRSCFPWNKFIHISANVKALLFTPSSPRLWGTCKFFPDGIGIALCFVDRPRSLHGQLRVFYFLHPAVNFNPWQNVTTSLPSSLSLCFNFLQYTPYFYFLQAALSLRFRRFHVTNRFLGKKLVYTIK